MTSTRTTITRPATGLGAARRTALLVAATLRVGSAPWMAVAVTPRASYTPAQNAQREKVNVWVRQQSSCGGIHPTGEGYRPIAASIPLTALR